MAGKAKHRPIRSEKNERNKGFQTCFRKEEKRGERGKGRLEQRRTDLCTTLFFFYSACVTIQA